MSRKIDGWQADDGKIFDTQTEADSHNAGKKLIELLEQCSTGYDRDFIEEDLFAHREQFVALFQAWTIHN